MNIDMSIKRISILSLQVLTILIGLTTLVLLLWEPHLEGRNVHATNFEIYFKDPFLAFVYVGSTPFFIALHRVFKILEYVKQGMLFSHATAKALRIVTYCALVIIGFVIVEEIFIVVNHGDDDIAGGVFMGVLVTLGSIIVATVSAVLERTIRNKIR